MVQSILHVLYRVGELYRSIRLDQKRLEVKDILYITLYYSSGKLSSVFHLVFDISTVIVKR